MNVSIQTAAGADPRASRRRPDFAMIAGASPVAALRRVPAEPEPRRAVVDTVVQILRSLVDRTIARFSCIATDPVLDVRDFAWTQALRDRWQDIRREAIAVAGAARAPCPTTVARDHRAIAEAGVWRCFFLWGQGAPIEANTDRCPVTSALVGAIPGLDSAFFSILPPGTHIAEHRGVTKGLVTGHLALVVPRDGDIRMRVCGRTLRWAEGETLIFDDTYRHEVWNDSSAARIVLIVQFARPLRQPGKWIADLFLRLARRSAQAG